MIRKLILNTLCIVVVCLFAAGCDDKEASAIMEKAKAEAEKAQAEKAQAEKAQAEKAQAENERSVKLDKIVNFFNTADSTAIAKSIRGQDVYATTKFKYDKQDETLSFYTIEYSEVTCMLQYFKISLRDAKSEIETKVSARDENIYNLYVYSSKCKIKAKLFVTKNYEDVSNRQEYIDFMNSEHDDADNSPGIQIILNSAMLPRYKKAFADLLELHDVEPLAY